MWIQRCVYGVCIRDVFKDVCEGGEGGGVKMLSYQNEKGKILILYKIIGNYHM